MPRYVSFHLSPVYEPQALDEIAWRGVLVSVFAQPIWPAFAVLEDSVDVTKRQRVTPMINQKCTDTFETREQV
jgi:hypothetical protein